MGRRKKGSKHVRSYEAMLGIWGLCVCRQGLCGGTNLLIYLFYWRIIALQCCGGLCSTSSWVSHIYMYKHIYIYIYISLSPLFSLPPPPSPLLSIITEHQAELLVLCSYFPRASYLPHGSVYMSTLLSQSVPPSPSPTTSTNLFSMSASPFLLCKHDQQYSFSRFHIYALMYGICWENLLDTSFRRSTMAAACRIDGRVQDCRWDIWGIGTQTQTGRCLNQGSSSVTKRHSRAHGVRHHRQVLTASWLLEASSAEAGPILLMGLLKSRTHVLLEMPC